MFPLEISVSEIRLEEKRLFMGVLRDVSARKAAEEALRVSEEKLRFLFENSPDHLMVVDRTGTVELLNRSTPAPFDGIKPGCLFIELFPSQLRNRYRRQLAQVFEHGQTDSFISTGDHDTWWAFRLAPLHVQGEHITQALIIATDITEKRSLKMQAIRTSRLAAIGVLATSVAHEINNPNNSMRFAASSLERFWGDIAPFLLENRHGGGPPSLAGMALDEAVATIGELLTVIRNNSERIKNTVAHIKRAGRKDKERFDHPVNVFDSLQAAASILQNEIVRHTDHFGLPDGDGVPLLVSGNPQQIEQVWINLIHNALLSLADRRKGVAVLLDVDRSSQTVRVTIRDEGVGIPREHLGKVLTPFFSTRRDSDGVGLGLTISNTIVEEHAGRMVLESAPGRGTTVTVTLPLARKELE